VKEATGNFVDVPALTITDFVLVALPAPLVAVNLTVYVPAVANLCVTLLVAPRGVVLSPKSQDHEVGVFVLVSANVNVVAVVPPDAGDTVKEATGSTGCGFTVTVPVFVLAPFRFVAVKVTVTVFVLVPVFVNVCDTGVPVTTGVPSPKFQDTLAAFVDVLVNSTVSGAIPEVALLLKLASGFGVGVDSVTVI
jgi:hypothetical protein